MNCTRVHLEVDHDPPLQAFSVCLVCTRVQLTAFTPAQANCTNWAKGVWFNQTKLVRCEGTVTSNLVSHFWLWTQDYRGNCHKVYHP